MILGNTEQLFLKKITIDDIETIRQWRNNPKISQFMNFRDEITKEMQLKWYQSIDNINNYYFMIIKNNVKIGLTEVKKINYKTFTAEAGIFIFEDKFLNATISYESILLLMNFAFENLMIKQLNIQVLESNKRAIRFNKSLGYKPNTELGSNWYTLTKNDYIKIEHVVNISKGK